MTLKLQQTFISRLLAKEEKEAAQSGRVPRPLASLLNLSSDEAFSSLLACKVRALVRADVHADMVCAQGMAGCMMSARIISGTQVYRGERKGAVLKLTSILPGTPQFAAIDHRVKAGIRSARVVKIHEVMNTCAARSFAACEENIRGTYCARVYI